MVTQFTIEIILFAIFSVLLLIIFRSSIKDYRSYGFFRFFAFEFIFALLLLNARSWFVQPLSVHQIISWLLLVSSLVGVISGFTALSNFGQPRDRLENTTVLVSVGIYRFIRHPLYASLLLFGWGAFFKQPSFLGAGLGMGLSICLYITAKREETENLEKFGDEYRAYMEDTNLFIPFIC